MNRMRQVFVVVAALLISGSPLVMSAAQTGPDATVRAELAAIVPAADDLPVGFTFVGETFLDAEDVAAGDIDAAAITDAGFISQYVSVYQHADSDAQIRSYVSAWNDAAAAEAGFTLLEDEARLLPDASLEDGDAALGDGPSESTTGSYRLEDGTAIGTADVTFRVDNLVIGVAVEKLDGSEADLDMATSLANVVAERASAVRGGEAPAQIDLALPGQLVPLAGEGTLMQAGFLGPVEIESIYGTQGSVLTGVETSWVEALALGDPTDSPPLIILGLTTFGSADDAAFTAENAAELFAPFPAQEVVEPAPVEGASTISAFRFASAEAGEVDSYRIVFATDGSMVVVDVVGAASAEDAENAANALASAQATCQAGGECAMPELPAGFDGE